MRIPVFVSRPTALNFDQETVLNYLLDELRELQLDPRTLGQSDYPTASPLWEVDSIVRHSAGGLILGFSQFKTETGTWKAGTDGESEQDGPVAFPTPWNQLEAGILFAHRLPLLVFREPGIDGGIFGLGTSDLFIHNLPSATPSDDERDSIR